jgi:predicted RNA-binding Zn ribbon-like protein
MTQSGRHFSGSLAIEFVNRPGDPEALLSTLSDSPLAASDARRFQRALRRIFRAGTTGGGAGERDLAPLNRVLRRAGACRGLRPTVAGYGWGWVRQPSDDVDRLWPVAWSAAQILASSDLGRLKVCDGCGRFFLDLTRNHSRRWCDMQLCGNRAKVKRHRSRVQGRKERNVSGGKRFFPTDKALPGH